ncbi:hypothetical protein [Aliamphritea spongicola]|nr:hypothetical protein [Aliamphritea spongicola]
MLQSLNTKSNTDLYSNLSGTLSKKLNGYTHGGFEQINSRFSENELKESFSEEELIQQLTLSYNLAIISVLYALEKSDNPELLSYFQELKIKN